MCRRPPAHDRHRRSSLLRARLQCPRLLSNAPGRRVQCPSLFSNARELEQGHCRVASVSRRGAPRSSSTSSRRLHRCFQNHIADPIAGHLHVRLGCAAFRAQPVEHAMLARSADSAVTPPAPARTLGAARHPSPVLQPERESVLWRLRLPYCRVAYFHRAKFSPPHPFRGADVGGCARGVRVNTCQHARPPTGVKRMRSFAECLHQEAPPELDVRAIGAELVERFCVPQDKVDELVKCCNQTEATTAARIMALPQSEATALSAASGFGTQEWSSLCICLGSASKPHTFAPDPDICLEPDAPLADQDAEMRTPLEKPDAKLKSSTKGGSLHAVAEQLSERRPPLVPGSYGPGAALDMYKNGARPFNSNVRAAVVKEVCCILNAVPLAHRSCAYCRQTLFNPPGLLRSSTCVVTCTRTPSSGVCYCRQLSSILDLRRQASTGTPGRPSARSTRARVFLISRRHGGHPPSGASPLNVTQADCVHRALFAALRSPPLCRSRRGHRH